MSFKKCKLVNHAVARLEYEYNPVAGAVNVQIKNGFNVKVPINDLKKPCIVEQMIEMSSENNSLNLKCIALSYFNVEGTSDEYDIEELRQYVFENGSPIAYKKMADNVKTITGLSNSNPLVLPPYQKVMQNKDLQNQNLQNYG
ncbi:hypothetical protein MmiHf6_15470 [Methanimicrococcus hongohii]|uniref:Uncharacterized protein n=1 Tax=Methanimicrococcus hongohii TaxID=3028295 RepID=A0AA96ZUX2_9EURY|nr:hypothetical protein [Methanimicrococcus sp. Hf6]WNY24217.1 hypothetical protein MmiHf6_15470 [Methanimicrococcus sp. Hf6]